MYTGVDIAHYSKRETVLLYLPLRPSIPGNPSVPGRPGEPGKPYKIKIATMRVDNDTLAMSFASFNATNNK